MITETEFIEEIKKATGREIGTGSYGFIMGTQCPFVVTRGMNSGMNRQGYMVWRKDGEVVKEISLIATSTEKNLEEVIGFLK